jgi:hypothetical protein
MQIFQHQILNLEPAWGGPSPLPDPAMSGIFHCRLDYNAVILWHFPRMHRKGPSFACSDMPPKNARCLWS